MDTFFLPVWGLKKPVWSLWEPVWGHWEPPWSLWKPVSDLRGLHMASKSLSKACKSLFDASKGTQGGTEIGDRERCRIRTICPVWFHRSSAHPELLPKKQLDLMDFSFIRWKTDGPSNSINWELGVGDLGFMVQCIIFHSFHSFQWRWCHVILW